jgi:hypothetical protein
MGRRSFADPLVQRVGYGFSWVDINVPGHGNVAAEKERLSIDTRARAYAQAGRFRPLFWRGHEPTAVARGCATEQRADRAFGRPGQRQRAAKPAPSR